MERNPWSPDVEEAINSAAQRNGLAPALLNTFAKIESSGNPNARTGSYNGLFQLSNNEFGKYGGGNIFNPADNANAAAQKLAGESASFKAKYGRDPSANDLYMIHQQGEGGYGAHVANPNAPAWQNMYSTAEGRQKGPGWAKQAIWGNVPSDVRSRYPGGVDSLTSQQFLDLWNDKVTRMGGEMPIGSNLGRNLNPGSMGAMAAQPVDPATAMPVPGGSLAQALMPPDPRNGKLADLFQSQAANAQPQGWGDLIRGLSSMVSGQGYADRAKEEQKTYSSKLAQLLQGAATPEALTSTLISSGDPDLQKAGIQAKLTEAQAQRKANAPLRGKERFLVTPNGVMDITTNEIVPGTARPVAGPKVPEGYRLTPDNNLTYIPGGPADPATNNKQVKYNEGQTKAANFGNMMTKANQKLLELAPMGADGKPNAEAIANPKGWGGVLRDTVVPGQDIRNSITPSGTQAYRQIANQWIRAKLRKESGAVIGPEEMESEFRTYFPQVGDGAEVLKLKSASRDEATKGMIAESGGAYGQLFPAQTPENAGQQIPQAGLPAASGAPKQIATPEEYRSLPAGVQYIAPDGSVRTKQ